MVGSRGEGAQALRALDNVPLSSTGAPTPLVAASEHRLSLVYICEDTDAEWDGISVREVSSETEEPPVAAVRFKSFRAQYFGAPNDEALAGHPLYDIGLVPYSAFEVVNSEWVAELCRRNRVHWAHEDTHYDAYRHFIFTFHDSTFEIVAKQYSVEFWGRRSPASALAGELDWVSGSRIG